MDDEAKELVGTNLEDALGGVEAHVECLECSKFLKGFLGLRHIHPFLVWFSISFLYFLNFLNALDLCFIKNICPYLEKSLVNVMKYE